MMEAYLDHCHTSLATYGKYVFTTLKTERHFYDFVGDQKSEDSCHIAISLSCKKAFSIQFSDVSLTLQECPIDDR